MYVKEPLLNFPNHERVYKDSICSGKWSQPPLQPNTHQNELCTTMVTVTKPAGNSFSQTRARLTVGHLCPWLVLPCLALPFLALPCLCCLVATGYMVKKLRGWVRLDFLVMY